MQISPNLMGRVAGGANSCIKFASRQKIRRAPLFSEKIPFSLLFAPSVSLLFAPFLPSSHLNDLHDHSLTMLHLP